MQLKAITTKTVRGFHIFTSMMRELLFFSFLVIQDKVVNTRSNQSPTNNNKIDYESVATQTKIIVMHAL
jgi:hypothetical protein